MINKYPTLYSFRRCPYAMRARLAIRLCKIQCIIREISLKAKNSEFLRVSPKATVPVLVLPNGEVLEESLDIMYWSLEQNDPSKLKTNNQLANKTNKIKYNNTYKMECAQAWPGPKPGRALPGPKPGLSQAV